MIIYYLTLVLYIIRIIGKAVNWRLIKRRPCSAKLADRLLEEKL